MLEIVCKHYNIDMNKKINDLKRKELDIILYGSEDLIEFNFSTRSGNKINKKEQEFKWNLGDIKPVHSDLLFDFFPADSENKYKPKVNIANYFNIVSHKIVKIVNRAERKE